MGVFGLRRAFGRLLHAEGSQSPATFLGEPAKTASCPSRFKAALATDLPEFLPAPPGNWVNAIRFPHLALAELTAPGLNPCSSPCQVQLACPPEKRQLPR